MWQRHVVSAHRCCTTCSVLLCLLCQVCGLQQEIVTVSEGKKKTTTKTTQDSHAYLAYLQTPPSTWLLCPADRPLLPWAELGATCSTGVDSSLEQQAVKAERVCI